MPRPIPCCRCLAGLSTWTGGTTPVCEDDESGSTKCTHCRKHGKLCIGPTGILKARGHALMSAMTTNPGQRTDSVKELQVAVKKALQAKKVSASLPAHKASEAEKLAATEREEHHALALDRIAVALEGISNSLKLLNQAYLKVHSDDLQAASDAGSGDEGGE